jgi:uncharacterized DUF497 family protein
VGSEFEWDEEKAAENLRKHGVSFPQAALAFRDPLAVDLFDDREDYEEDRFLHIGSYAGQVLTVAYTERGGDRIRIISARRATKDEQEYYQSQNRI